MTDGGNGSGDGKEQEPGQTLREMFVEYATKYQDIDMQIDEAYYNEEVEPISDEEMNTMELAGERAAILASGLRATVKLYDMEKKARKGNYDTF